MNGPRESVGRTTRSRLKVSDFISAPPPVESFLADSTGVWGGLVDASLTQQIADRKELRARLDQPVDAGLYRSLNRLLDSGDNDRFILYCPLSLVPAASQYRRQDEAADRFSELYLQSWCRLLQVHDIRANFVDGDVPDKELGEQSENWVVQAAFLIPTLAGKGLISHAMVSGYLGQDEIRDRSIEEALAPDQRTTSGQWHGDSPKRARWLRWEERRSLIETLGKSLGADILANGISDFKILDDDSSNVFIAGIGSAIEQAMLGGQRERALELYQQLEIKLITGSLQPSLREYVSRVYCRLYSIGVVDREKLEEVDIFLPGLDGPLHPNLAIIVDGRKAVRDLLETDRELRDMIYPVAMVYGSQLKGYGGLDADTDLAVFVRPELRLGPDRDIVERVLRSKFGREVVQYWLEVDGDNLRVRSGVDLGVSTDTHVLFGGAWEGESTTIAMLSEKLLKPYLYSSDPESRRVWLEEMERNFLQYRLLHRGYERVRVPRANEVYWDEGYRWTAAKLYASHVFIPQSGDN